jgi:endonuclease/exonuclease/phosphatase (EEP) superfamily protein YafD
MTWRRARTLVACLLGGLSLLPLAARTAGRRPPPAPGRLGAVPVQAAALSPVAAVAGLGAVALAASVAWWLAGLLTIPATWLAIGQLPRRRGRTRARGPAPGRWPAPTGGPTGGPARGPGPALRILTLNARFGAADPAVTVEAVRRYRADVLAVQELTPEFVCGLAAAGAGDLLPHVHADPQPGAAGTGLWSRYPLTPLPPVPGLFLAAPSASITVAGQPVTLRSVHPVAPIMGRQDRWHQDLARLREALTATPGPQVIAGDFNASRDHRPFRDLLAAGFADCADIAVQRSWPGFTWPADRRLPPVMRLDHILVSPGIAVSAARTVQIPGTDHRAVLAVLELAGPALRLAASRPAEHAVH